jgi:hypothetical protein
MERCRDNPIPQAGAGMGGRAATISGVLPRVDSAAEEPAVMRPFNTAAAEHERRPLRILPAPPAASNKAPLGDRSPGSCRRHTRRLTSLSRGEDRGRAHPRR